MILLLSADALAGHPKPTSELCNRIEPFPDEPLRNARYVYVAASTATNSISTCA